MQKFSFKRLTAWMLTILMVVSVAPVSVYADAMDAFLGDITEYFNSKGDPLSALGASIAMTAEDTAAMTYAANTTTATTVLDAAIFCSDVHGNSSAVSSAFSGIKNADSTFNPSTATFVGDTQMAASSVTSAAQSVYSDVACYYAYGNHDSDGYGISDVTGLLYSGSNYYIYAISQTSMASSNPDTSGFTSTVAGLDKTKPLFIASHLPLHSRRGDSNGAAAWYEAISAAAESMDIVFFWAHNHTDEDDVDRAAFYVAKDGNETFTLENTSTKVTPNFTYMNAGFVGKSSSRGGVVTTVKIYSDALVFQDYTSSGAFTGEYSHNVEVAREFANTTDSGSGDNSGDNSGTTGGSTETVVGEGTYTTADDGSYQKVTFGSSTTETKTVYVLVSTPTAGKNYIIASDNSAGNVYALKENTTTGTSVTVNAATGSITAPYIENSDNAIVWTASSGMNFKSVNGGYYLNYTQRSSSYSLSFGTSSSSASDWTAGTNQLYRNGRSNDYYLRCNNDTWAMGSSNITYNVYFYEEQTIDTSSSVTYSVTASDIEHFYTADTTDTETVTITKSVTDGTPTGTYAYAIVGGDDIITSIDQSTGVITLNGTEGTAQVKISYTWTEGENTYTIWQVIDVTATSPYYTLDITKGDDVVSGTTVAIKGVTANQTMQLGTQITFVSEDGPETLDSLPEGAVISWHIPEEYQTIATINHDTGLVTFKGVDGAFYVTATLTVGSKDYTVRVDISATTSQYSVPSAGTQDFPEYPNEGAIRFDKTATAVGNFSETGIAQVELSMTGVPYSTGSEIDVVLMLDMTGSMDDVSSSTSKPTGYVRIDATIAASKAFIETIVKNEDGSYNGNRIGVYVFNKNGAATLFDFGTVDSDTELQAIYGDLETIKDDHFASGGTPYDDGLAECKEVLAAAKTDGIGNNRQQFTVFMTDGVPTSYAYVNGTTYGTHSSASDIAGMLTNNYATRDTDYKYEYYSTEMKKAGVTVYSVGVGLENENNAWSGSSTQCLNLASVLLNDISGPAGETTQPDAVGTSTLSKKDEYFFSVEDATAATDMEKVFSNIAQKILQAATDITVEDKITDEYTMIFDIPTGSQDITGVTNNFYIEFVKYALDEDHERTDDVTSVTKLYLEKNGTTYSAASDSNGTAYAAPVFEQKTIGDKGTLYYWSTNASDGDAGVSVTVDGNTYYFVSYGMETAGYNMTSGAYAYGTVDSDTNMSNNLVIATPYFVYNASTKMLYWTVDKLDTAEYALRYFLYLDRSATEIGTINEVPAGTYYTNDHAYITYTNFQGNDCRQEFDKPQMTWNGAQVSYVFYLVNADGTPINRSGQVVDFANASFVTDIYTTSVVWNKEGDTQTGTGELSADWLADDLLPEEYEIYDEQARYVLNVYENANGTTIWNEFTISGNNAAGISSSLNTRLDLDTTESTVSTKTTKVYNTKAGEKISNYGTYTSADSNMNGFDFANTTVAFAVVWQPRLVEDTVVVDYGLDVLINVVENDILQNTVSGIGLGNAAYGNIAMNTGVSTDAKFGKATQTTGQGATISIENETSIRYHQNDMIFSGKDVFYYESPVEFWEGSNPKEGYMYSSVTVIPATSIYYEESFMTFKNTDGSEWPVTKSEDGFWNQVQDDNYKSNPTQSQDRPGESQISGSLDADNIYGYDPAYDNYTTYSLGQAMKVNVDSKTGANDVAPTVSFTFKGTGFDVVSMTDNTSGAIAVNVDKINTDGTTTKDFISTSVDNYYGYTYKEYPETIKVVKFTENLDKTTEVVYYKNGEEVVEYSVYLTIGTKERCIVDSSIDADTLNVTRYAWEVPEETEETTDNNAIYQVPVIKIDCEEYAEYQVTIKLLYFGIFDHVKDNGYTFVMDAVRIYDPANSGKGDNTNTIKDAYEADGEYMPVYLLIKDSILSSASVDGSTQLDGIVFIDGMNGTSSIDDYTNPGPNNEAYLANGQSISFKLKADKIPEGMAIDQVHIGMKLAYGEEASVKVVDNVERVQTLKTATDMYYDLDVSWNNDNTSTVIQIINTTEGAVISLTNVKVTFKSTADAASDSGENNFSSGVNTVETDNVPVVQFLTDNEVVENALLLKKESAPEAPVFTPETFEVEVTRNRSGNNETVTVKTSADVETITINGIEVTKFKEVKGERTWTYKPKKADIADQYEVIAYNAEGLASATVYAVYEAGEANLGKFHFSNLFSKDFESGYNVFDAFHGYGNNAHAEKMMAVMEKLAARFFKPEKLQMNYQEQADGNSMLVVNTSEDVEYIVADGEIVNNFITETIIDLSKDGEETVNRVWLVPDADENAEVAAYNAEGVACNAENN